jgi:hypothetical protein
MKSSFHRLIHFLPLFCNCQLSSIPLLPSSYPGRLAFRNSTQFHYVPASFAANLYNHFARTTQKTQPLYCSESMFTGPLHSNGSYSIIACVFVVSGMCLQSLCLAINVFSDFTIPAFGSHVTVQFRYICLTDRSLGNFLHLARWQSMVT